MAETTEIGWTDATWNPWMGCDKVSPGCAHCYMFRDQERYGRDPSKVVRSKTKFTEPLKWAEPRRIFTCSWSDWFHPDADQWRDEAWEVIRQTPQHTYQILTKRPERASLHLPKDWGLGWENVWLGTSVENQRWAHRIDFLPLSAGRFVSAEPLLGPLDLSTRIHLLSWVIVGGESGPEARPMDLAWAREIREQCRVAGVDFFFKQASGPRPGMPSGDPDLDSCKAIPVGAP